MIEEDDFVLVVGSAGIDMKGKPDGPLKSGIPNQGHIRNSVGGVARNIAENLARLEIPVVLLTAVGDDAEGERVIDACEALDIDCDSVLTVDDARTGTYMALLTPEGELDVAISDFEIMRYLTPAYLHENEDLFEDAAMVVIDATMTPESIKTVFELAEKYDVPVCADPTTPELATKLCDYIPQLYLVVPNAAETTALCGLQNPAKDRDSAIEAARHLVTLGTEIAVVTVGEEGLSYADSNGGGFIKAPKVHVVDSTGAGDALSAAIIFGLLNDIAIDDAMKLGVGAAALTLQTRETVPHALNPETLYDMLA
ncbi:carbohydrate kinase family protein [Phototrophicus methaneseepsis]|uniref:Carbohydrate kinase family protein n=1 Tax=Phototrophicus methaneseepsis TaxID=2710758 RepID=A0A7S8IE74_9CHLR|nr:carbohydrate kinase family protein [Phototrophicus methaneseepsis]QPC82272.1 carbohydrate kinase family protein [Phototrophicus methaneseepsis]